MKVQLGSSPSGTDMAGVLLRERAAGSLTKHVQRGFAREARL